MTTATASASAPIARAPGLDCDDADDTVGRPRSSLATPVKQGTLGVGTCQAGQAVCTDGVWGPCVGEVTPGGEACNGLDDDCNGKTTTTSAASAAAWAPVRRP